MDGFFAKRAADPRFKVHGAEPWYQSGLRVDRHTFAAPSSDTPAPASPKKTDEPEKKKKKKKTLTEGETSDNTDAGVCYSDYERKPGTKEGEKGSCRPKGGKKKKASE